MGGIGPTGSDMGPENQHFALKWNDFHTSIVNSFKYLRDEKDFIDVTIACDGCSFTAHKVVLSACSPYFRSLLKANPCQHPIVILQDVQKDDMDALLKYMYNGEVHIAQDQLPDFLKTAQALQIRGLAEVASKDQHKLISNMSSSIPWPSGDDNQSVHSNTKRSRGADTPSPSKKSRFNENQNLRYSVSPPVNRGSISSDNADGKPSSLSDSVHSLPQGDERPQSAQNSHPVQSSNEDSNDTYDDEASDAEAELDGNDTGNANVHDMAQPRLDAPDFAIGDRGKADALVNPSLFDTQRQRGGYPPISFNFQNLQNLQDIAGLIPGLSGMHNNSQDSYGLMRRNSEVGKVRATDPRPCPKCNKIYRSAHTLRTHLEDKHTICPGYRCVLCGTVAKSRNSLHSHMSRQHRGISTKDLPVVPMPSIFDPELASQLYHKAGIKMSASELRARASPPSVVASLPRRSDPPRPDVVSSENNSMSADEDPQDLSMSANKYYHANATSMPYDFNLKSKMGSIGSLLMNSILPRCNSVDKENMDSTT